MPKIPDEHEGCQQSLALAHYNFSIEYEPGRAHSNIDVLLRLKSIITIATDTLECKQVWSRDTIWKY